MENDVIAASSPISLIAKMLTDNKKDAFRRRVEKSRLECALRPR